MFFCIPPNFLIPGCVYGYESRCSTNCIFYTTRAADHLVSRPPSENNRKPAALPDRPEQSVCLVKEVVPKGQPLFIFRFYEMRITKKNYRSMVTTICSAFDGYTVVFPVNFAGKRANDEQ